MTPEKEETIRKEINRECYSDEDFHIFQNDEDCVWEFFPKTHNDGRGYFRVDWDGKAFEIPNMFRTLDWVRQINTSFSKINVFRGMHAQRGRNCQGKLVTCKNGLICDIIVDCRPTSSTFLKAKTYLLDSKIGSRLWVPKGFLHGFFSIDDNSVFEYFCDAPYDKDSETGVNLHSVLFNDKVNVHDASMLSGMINVIKDDGKCPILSEKDDKQQDLDSFLSSISENWYR